MVSFSLKELEANYNVNISWRSFELRPKGSPPISDQYRAAIAEKRDHFHQMAREQYGVEINTGPFGVDSRPALVGAKIAEANDVGDAYHDAVFRAYWQEGKSIEETAVLADIAENVGLNRDEFLQALEEDDWQTAVTADVYQAHQFGLSGVPAAVFGNKYLLSGAQPYPVFEQVMAKLEEDAQLASG